MKKRIFIALIILLMLVPLSIASAKTEKQLRFDTSYTFVGSAPDPAYGNRNLAWEGFIFEDGVEVGTIQYWMFLGPGLPEPPLVTRFDDAIWIITLGDEEIWGYQWGSTTWIPGFERANWRANGVVEEATGIYEYLEGRPMHDGGKVVLSTFPFYGVGKLHINK